MPFLAEHPRHPTLAFPAFPHLVGLDPIAFLRTLLPPQPVACLDLVLMRSGFRTERTPHIEGRHVMLFCSQKFLFFFAVVFTVYWSLPWPRTGWRAAGREFLVLCLVEPVACPPRRRFGGARLRHRPGPGGEPVAAGSTWSAGPEPRRQPRRALHVQVRQLLPRIADRTAPKPGTSRRCRCSK